MDKVIAEFQRLMAELPEKGQDTTGLLLRLMDPERAHVLEVCAIPHSFNEEVMVAMLPELDPARARSLCEQFTKLSLVLTDPDGFSLHDRARKEIFRSWLFPERRGEFSAISLRLVDYFQFRAGGAKEQALEHAKRLRMFHLIGADPEAGFAEFQSLCRRARSQFRLSECATLLRLVHEYDAVLTPEQALWLSYHEGKLHSDLHQWEDAERLFKSVLDDEAAPAELRVKALVRLGYLYVQRREWEQAIDIYQKALPLAEAHPAARGNLCRILHDLGAAYRETGRLEESEKLLRQGLEFSGAREDRVGMSMCHNSLGMLQLKRGDVPAAIDAFNVSLGLLSQEGEVYRSAQVLNNLGLAYGKSGEWQASEESYLKSLEIKRQAGDTLGQAFALNNLARTQVNRNQVEAAIASLSEAISLFDQMHDNFELGVARHNRGKLYRRLKNRECCEEDLLEGIRLFRLCDKSDEADSVQEDLDSLTKKTRLPWWAWVGILLFPLLFALFAYLVE